MKLVTQADEIVQNSHAPGLPNTNEISRHVLLFIESFWQAFPDPLDLSELKSDLPDDAVRSQILNWLVSQGILANPDDRFVLTLAGRRSLQRVLGTNRCLAEFIPQGGFVLNNHNHCQLLILILMTHFDDYKRINPGPQ